MFALLPWTIDHEIRGMIRSGAVAYELARPIDLYGFWYSRNLAGRIAPTLLRSLPIFVLAWIAFDLQLPPSLAAAGAWLLSTLSAVLLAGAIATLLSIALLWTISGEGISQIIQVSIFVFSGMIVPLPLFPDWSQPLLNALPFRGLVDIPFRFYTGDLTPDQLLPHLAHQLAWTLALVLLGRWLLSRGMRRLVVQGG
jgi:ABC-2 type transport system permease protein